MREIEGAYEFSYAEYTSVTERVYKSIDLNIDYVLADGKGLLYPCEFEGIYFYLAIKPGVGVGIDLYRKDVYIG